MPTWMEIREVSEKKEKKEEWLVLKIFSDPLQGKTKGADDPLRMEMVDLAAKNLFVCHL